MCLKGGCIRKCDGNHLVSENYGAVWPDYLLLIRKLSHTRNIHHNLFITLLLGSIA